MLSVTAIVGFTVANREIHDPDGSIGTSERSTQLATYHISVLQRKATTCLAPSIWLVREEAVASGLCQATLKRSIWKWIPVRVLQPLIAPPKIICFNKRHSFTQSFSILPLIRSVSSRANFDRDGRCVGEHSHIVRSTLSRQGGECYAPAGPNQSHPALYRPTPPSPRK